METIRAVGVVFAVGFGLWGIPAAWEHWSRPRRLAARIERYGKALEKVENHRVRDVLQADIERAGVELAAVVGAPVPRSRVWSFALSIAIGLGLGAANLWFPWVDKAAEGSQKGWLGLVALAAMGVVTVLFSWGIFLSFFKNTRKSRRLFAHALRKDDELT